MSSSDSIESFLPEVFSKMLFISKSFSYADDDLDEFGLYIGVLGRIFESKASISMKRKILMSLFQHYIFLVNKNKNLFG
jgi:hypothetical protein